jgi:DNA-binding IclR family transcriptional regulator
MIWLNVVMKLRRSWSGVDALQSLLDQLAQTIGESIGLGIPDLERRRMLLSAWALSSDPIRVHLSQFPVMPMHALAAGKCYLAGMTDQELHAWLQGGLERVTDHTMTSPRQLLQEIAETRERGYAISREESVPGASGLAVALKDGDGRVIAALGITAPSERMTEANIELWLPVLRSYAERTSRQLATLPGAVTAPNSSEQSRIAKGNSGPHSETEGKRRSRAV